MELLSVPFTRRFFNETGERFITVRGVLRTEEDGLVLEFRRSETDFGTTASQDDIRTVHVPWAEVQSLEYRLRFLWRAALMLRTRGLRTLGDVPGVRGNEMSFSIARGDRLAARELAATVGLFLADQRLAALEAPSHHPRALPPS
jgi:hypothetical protein